MGLDLVLFGVWFLASIIPFSKLSHTRLLHNGTGWVGLVFNGWEGISSNNLLMGDPNIGYPILHQLGFAICIVDRRSALLHIILITNLDC